MGLELTLFKLTLNLVSEVFIDLNYEETTCQQQGRPLSGTTCLRLRHNRAGNHQRSRIYSLLSTWTYPQNTYF